jgi:hypothetical protein
LVDSIDRYDTMSDRCQEDLTVAMGRLAACAAPAGSP